MSDLHPVDSQLIAGAAAFEVRRIDDTVRVARAGCDTAFDIWRQAEKAYERHVAQNGPPPNHQFAKVRLNDLMAQLLLKDPPCGYVNSCASQMTDFWHGASRRNYSLVSPVPKPTNFSRQKVMCT